jgi:hypothetical protein
MAWHILEYYFSIYLRRKEMQRWKLIYAVFCFRRSDLRHNGRNAERIWFVLNIVTDVIFSSLSTVHLRLLSFEFIALNDYILTYCSICNGEYIA